MRDEAAFVFVEVKLRGGKGFGDPLEAVTPEKRARIRFTAEQYLAEQGEDFVAGFNKLHFDVVGILISETEGRRSSTWRMLSEAWSFP